MIRDCPKCGAVDALETNLRIDLDDVVIGDNNEVVSFILAGSANDESNGIVTEEARVSCRECGYETEGYVPMHFTGRWTYREPDPRLAAAQRLCHLLNKDWAPSLAIPSAGLALDEVSSEDPGLELDDPDNAVIDLHYDENGVCIYLQRHADRWHIHTLTKED